MGADRRGCAGFDMDSQAPVVRAASLADVRDLLALAEKDDVQRVGLDEVLTGCIFFMLDAPGNRLGYALKPVGRELWIQAAGGEGAADLTSAGLTVIEGQAVGLFESVGFQTRRAGLVRKAKKLGYIIDGYILRKTI